MCIKLDKTGKTAVVILVLFVAVTIGVFCINNGVFDTFRTNKTPYDAEDYSYVTHESIFLRTDREIYDEDDLLVGMLINLSPHSIEVKRGEPLIYQMTDIGWLPPMGTLWTMLVYPSPYEKGWVQPGCVLPINMSFFKLQTLTKPLNWKMLELQYFYSGDEYVVYSNEFVVGESSQPPRFRTPPSDLSDALRVDTEIVEPYVIALTNNSKLVLWFNSLCSDVQVDIGYPTDYSAYATLQQQSGEGTWQVLRPDEERCTTTGELIRIEPGETVQLFVGDGYPSPDELDPGVYRWHLVIYIDPFPECNTQHGCFLSGEHLFTENFEP